MTPRTKESTLLTIIVLMQQKVTNSNQPKGRTNGVERGRLPEEKLLLSLGTHYPPSISKWLSMLSIAKPKIHLSFEVQGFLWRLHDIDMTGWIIAHWFEL